MEMYLGSVESYLGRTRAAVEKIQDRGGKVVFIRAPSSGKLREMENQFSPRPGFWDRISNGVEAAIDSTSDGMESYLVRPTLAGSRAVSGMRVCEHSSSRCFLGQDALFPERRKGFNPIAAFPQ